MISLHSATAAVAVGTVFFVRRMKRSENAIEDYFAVASAGAACGGGILFLLTNLSTEQLVGLNGAVFQDGRLVGIAWEVLSAFAMMGCRCFSCQSIWPVVLRPPPVTSSSGTTA